MYHARMKKRPSGKPKAAESKQYLAGDYSTGIFLLTFFEPTKANESM